MGSHISLRPFHSEAQPEIIRFDADERNCEQSFAPEPDRPLNPVPFGTVRHEGLVGNRDQQFSLGRRVLIYEDETAVLSRAR